MDDTAPTLARREKSAIVLMALLQSLLLYLVEYGDGQGWPVLSDLSGQVPWYTLVLVVPSIMQLSLQRLDDTRFWSNTLLATAIFGAAAAWAAWSVTGAPGTAASATLGPFAVSMALIAFVALPYLQVRLAIGRFGARYDDLFALAWQNALTLKVVGVMTGLGWLLLTLWQALFQLIGIDLFHQLFSEEPFIYMASGLFAGLGVLVARTQHRAMQVARNVLFAIFTGFLPMAAFIGVIFLLTLPFTGLAPLRAAASTAATLSLLVAALVLLLNAVVQNGRESPYPRPLRWLVDAAMVALPVFAGIALHAVIVRIVEHGWTTDRFWALVAVVMLCTYAAGYAWTALRPEGAWMAKLPRVNVAASLLLMGLGLLANSPVLDPHRLAVASQLARVEEAAGNAVIDEAIRSRIEYLRFESGRRGVAALEALAQSPQASKEFLSTLAEIRERPARHPWEAEDTPPESAAQLAARLRVPAGQPAPTEALLAAVVARSEEEGPYCSRYEGTCIANHVDVDADGRADVLLCHVAGNDAVSCHVFVESDGVWSAKGQISPWIENEGQRKATIEAIQEGRITTVAPRFRDLAFGDTPPQRVESFEASAVVATP
jgi:hypothetical protein